MKKSIKQNNIKSINNTVSRSTSNGMKKIFIKISSVSIIVVLFFGFISPFFAFAATPTIKLELRTQSQDPQTLKWAWLIDVNTLNISDGTKLWAYLYKNGTLDDHGYVTISNNFGMYNSGFTLDQGDEGTTNTYKLKVMKVENPQATGIFEKIVGEGGGVFKEDPPTSVDPDKENSNSKSDNVYKLLAPIGDFTEAPTDIGDYFNKIFLIAIGLCGALAVIMIIIGGIQYMGDESIFGKTEAKSKITAAIFGLLIALGAYALLNTINPALLGGKIDIKQVSAEIDMDVHGDTPQSSAVNGKYCNGRVVKDAEVDTVTGRRWDSDSLPGAERKKLEAVGITIQRPNSCKKVGDKNCTTLTGLKVDKVISFKNKCVNCAVVINGATECWNHSPKTEHYPGNSIVDIDDTNSVDAYIKKGKKTRDSKNKYDIYEIDGMRFLDEGNHYHVISW